MIRLRFFVISTVLLSFLSLIGCSGPGPSSSEPVAIAGSKSVLYIANEFARTLNALELASGSNRTAIRGLDPTANDIVRRPHTNEIWVLHSETASILKYSIQTNEEQAPVFLESVDLFLYSTNPNPYSLAFSASGNYYYVTNWLENTIGCYDVNTNIPVNGHLNVGVAPQGIAVLPDGRVVVTNTNYLATQQFGIGSIMVIDSLASEVQNTIQVGVNPQVARVNGNDLYVVCTGNYNDIGGALWHFNATSLAVIGTPIVFSAFVGDLAIGSDSTGGLWGYLPAWSLSTNSVGTVQAVRLDNWVSVGAIQLAGGPSRITMLPDSGFAVSLFESDQIFVRTKAGVGYYFSASDGPKALLAVEKSD
ncbi:MAG: hypothetical protein OEM52_09905 [bacterium]|nr:hypothetical protein [bacterium]